jgi:chromosome segregation ATPase
MGTNIDEISTIVPGELVAWLTTERMELQREADDCKQRLEDVIEKREKAKREYPVLVKDLETKRKLFESLPAEIAELENRVAQAENIKDDDETTPLSGVMRAKQEYQRADYAAKTFVSHKMDELKRLAQG